MKKLKFIILETLILISIGFALVTTNVSLDGSTILSNNKEDFLVYFSDTRINGIQDTSILKMKNRIIFAFELNKINQEEKIEFDITNASTNYNALVTISCIGENEYITINNPNNEFTIESRTTTSSYIVIKQIKSAVNETPIIKELSCTLNVNALEKTTVSTEPVPSPPVETIKTFQTSEGTTYQFADGMTWEEWINSEYNIDGFEEEHTEIRETNYSEISKDTYIEENKTYMLTNYTMTERTLDIVYASPTDESQNVVSAIRDSVVSAIRGNLKGTENIESVQESNSTITSYATITFIEGMTWEEWVNSSFNDTDLSIERYEKRNVDVVGRRENDVVFALSKNDSCSCDSVITKDSTMPTDATMYYLVDVSDQV